MKTEFDVVGYGGQDRRREEMTRKPPRSAKLVARVEWSWSPAHSRSDTY